MPFNGDKLSKKDVVLFIDGNMSNFRLDNLTLSSCSKRNTLASPTGIIKEKGVVLGRKGKYKATIYNRDKKKLIYIGQFDSAEEAVNARNKYVII